MPSRNHCRVGAVLERQRDLRGTWHSRMRTQWTHTEPDRTDSNGRRNGIAEGVCDGRSAAFGSGPSREATIAGSPRGRVAGDATGVLGIHCLWPFERGRSHKGRDLATGRFAVVPDGGRDGAHPPVAVVQAALRALSFAEREEIALLRAQGHGVREVARCLARAASTISRELHRNAATRSGGLDYRATTAQWHAERSARRPKQSKLAANTALRTYVRDRLAGSVVTPGGTALPGPNVAWKGRRHGRRMNRRWGLSWSQQQIAECLRLDFPDDTTMRISHEAIYQALYVQGRGALKRELTAYLRTGRALRVPRARSLGARPSNSLDGEAGG